MSIAAKSRGDVSRPQGIELIIFLNRENILVYANNSGGENDASSS